MRATTRANRAAAASSEAAKGAVAGPEPAAAPPSPGRAWDARARPSYEEISQRAYFIALEQGEATRSPTGCRPSASSRPLDDRVLEALRAAPTEATAIKTWRRRASMMLTEHEQRFARIVSDYLQRPAGDYAELLHRGHVSSPNGVDPQRGGRRSARRRAATTIRVITSRDGEGAVAALNRAVDDQEVRDELERAQVLRQLAATARSLGHEPGHWHQESVCFCQLCDARIYVRTGAQPVSDGEALSERCPAPSCAPPAT